MLLVFRIYWLEISFQLVKISQHPSIAQKITSAYPKHISPKFLLPGRLHELFRFSQKDAFGYYITCPFFFLFFSLICEFHHMIEHYFGFILIRVQELKRQPQQEPINDSGYRGSQPPLNPTDYYQGRQFVLNIQ